jgi:hypothetical protein
MTDKQPATDERKHHVTVLNQKTGEILHAVDMTDVEYDSWLQYQREWFEEH